MGYLSDRGVWLCVGLGFVAVTSISLFGHLLASAAANPNVKPPRILWLIASIAFFAYAFAAFDLTLKYLQARYGINPEPYSPAYLVGGFLGLDRILVSVSAPETDGTARREIMNDHRISGAHRRFKTTVRATDGS